MKRFTIPCDFQSRKWPIEVYVGEPASGKHPLQYQAQWLTRERNGLIPPETWQGFEQISILATKHSVSCAELCSYACSPNISAEQKTHKLQHLHGSLKLGAGWEMVRGQIESADNKPMSADQHADEVAVLADSLLKKTHPETVAFVFETGRRLWPSDDEQSLISRSLFFGVALCFYSSSKKPPTLSDVYRILISEDLSYTLAILLDTSGKAICPLAHTLIGQWLNCKKQLRETSAFWMTTTLTEFALSSGPTEDVSQSLRTGLRQSIMTASIAILNNSVTSS